MGGPGRPVAGKVDAFARILVVLTIVSLLAACYRVFNACDTPFLAFAIIAAAAVHWSARPGWREMSAMALLATAVACAYAWSGGVVGRWPGAKVVAAGASCGMASLLILTWKAARKTEALEAFLQACCIPLFTIIANLALVMMIPWSPLVYDHVLFRFDGALGGQPAFWFGRLFARVEFLRDICFIVYAALPLVYALWMVLFFRGHSRRDLNPLKVFALAGLLGFIAYQVCPGGGPLHVFGAAYPNRPPIGVSLRPVPLEPTPRNAMPSLHSAWVFLLWWNLRDKRYWNWTFALFLLFTLAATLGFGEHWFIDLVVAVPFACAVQLLCRTKWQPASACAALTMGWLVYFRYGFAGFSPSAPVAWMMVAATVSIPLAPYLFDTIVEVVGNLFRHSPDRVLQIRTDAVMVRRED